MSQNLEQLTTETVAAPTQAHYNLLNLVWRRKSLILLGIVVGVVCGALDYAQRLPVYKIDAQILVVKKRPDILPAVSGDVSFSYYEDYLATHQILIRSLLIAGRAAKKPGIAELNSLHDSRDPAGRIIGSLTVNREIARDAAGMAPNILNLSYRGQEPGECAIILNAVIESYKDFLDDTYRNVSDDTVQLITKARDVLHNDLDHKAEEYRKFRQESPLFWKGKDGVSFAQERLGSWESKLSSLFLQRTELEARLTAMNKALAAGQNRQALAATLPLLLASGNSENGRRLSPFSLEEQLLPLLQQEEALLEDYGPNHPQVEAIRKRIALTRKLLARTGTGRSSARQGDADDPNEDDPVTLYLQSLKQQVSDIQITEKLLAERIKGEYEEAKRLADYQSREESFHDAIAQGKQLYDSIIKRLQEVGIVKDFGGYYARVITPPSGGRQVEPRALPIFSVAIFLGLMGGFSLAYLADWSDKSFRTPEEIQRHLGVPVVGHISRIVGEDQEVLESPAGRPVLDPVLTAYHRARSPEAEAYRGVRTALYFSSHGKEYKLLQVTSPVMGDGKTTTVANLGISIAQSGKRTLLIDADFRRPKLHELFGLSAPVGIASVLAGEVALDEAIQHSLVPGLDILPCGPIPPNPAELLTSPRFQEVLGTLRERFDLVMIDTPPLLAVSDPAVVAPRVEGVLIVLRYSKDGRPSAQRAKQILDTLGVNVLGVVVNAVNYQSAEGKYGYVRHRYSYGYGYGDMSNHKNGNGHVAHPSRTAANGRQGVLSWLRGRKG